MRLKMNKKMVHDLMPVDPASTPSKTIDPVSEPTVVHTLEEEIEEEEVFTAVDTNAFTRLRFNSDLQRL